MKPAHTGQHIIICGLGHVGCRMARLYRLLGITGTIITLEISGNWYKEQTGAFEVLVGNARDERLLRKAGIERAHAILAVTNDDLANVDICIEARRLNPNIRLVARLFDEGLAEHMEGSFKIDRVFSASALAVPAFMAAALGNSTKDSLLIADTVCSREETSIVPGSVFVGKTLADWEKASGQRAFALEGNGELHCPVSPDSVIPAGGKIHSLCLHPELEREVLAPTLKMKARLRRFLLGVVDWWKDVPKAFRVALVSLSSIIILSVVLFHYSIPFRWIDSLYLVVTTVTTVGYGDLNLANASDGLKLYGVFLMLCSAGLRKDSLKGFNLESGLALVYRSRVAAGSADIGSPVAAFGPGLLWLRKKDGGALLPALDNPVVSEGDEVFGVEWHPFVGASTPP